MESASVPKSIITINAAIHAYGAARWREALSLLEEAEKTGLEMDFITLAGALAACECGHWESALCLLARCLEQSWTPHGLHVGSVLKAMSEESCWERSLGLLRDFYRVWDGQDTPSTKNLPDPDFKARHEFAGGGDSGGGGGGGGELPPLPVLFRGEGLVAFAKPAGLASEQALSMMAVSCSTPLFAVSRLDLPTSGVLPAALGTEASPEARWYLAQFASGSLVRKEYLCLCQGRLGAPGTVATVAIPLQVVATSPTTSRAVPSNQGKSARTDFTVLSVLADEAPGFRPVTRQVPEAPTFVLTCPEEFRV